MRSRDSAPDNSDSASVDLTLGLVDVGDSLDVSHVHVGFGCGGDLVWSGLVFGLPFLSLKCPEVRP